MAAPISSSASAVTTGFRVLKWSTLYLPDLYQPKYGDGKNAHFQMGAPVENGDVPVVTSDPVRASFTSRPIIHQRPRPTKHGRSFIRPVDNMQRSENEKVTAPNTRKRMSLQIYKRMSLQIYKRAQQKATIHRFVTACS
jgi:hypothetical protein